MLAAAGVVGTVVDVFALAGDALLVFTMAITLVGVEVVIMTLIVVVDFVCVLAMFFDLSPKVVTVAVDVVPIGVL